MVKERPIIFSGAMVTAILENRKFQTRRPIKPQPDELYEYGGHLPEGHVFCPIGDSDAGLGMRDPLFIKRPYGQPGDRLWVRETWNYGGDEDQIYYKATQDTLGSPFKFYPAKWKPSTNMPREASRILLEITDVRVERVQDISEEDAKAEGFDYREHFIRAWDSIYAKRGLGWDLNPWVWVLEFKRRE